MLTTNGGSRAKLFDWTLVDDYVKIKNENGRQEEYHLAEILIVLNCLTERFGTDWFPLGNNLAKLGDKTEADGLGVAVLQQQPKNISHAQGSSYLGVVLEHAEILQWNKRSRGIKWRIISQVKTLDELRHILKSKLA